MSLSTSTVIITGASDGIGEQTAYAFAKEGVNLILLGRDIVRLNKVASKSKKLGSPGVYFHAVDLTNASSIQVFCEKLSKDHKRIDGIVNCAGIWQKLASLENISDEEILTIIHTNLTGLILLTKKIIPLLSNSSNAFIINISSRSGYSAQSGQSVYSASKYGVRGFTEVLREDLKNSNIRVAGIYQGGTNTEMFNKAGENFSKEKLSALIPPSELANVLVFLATRPVGIWLPEIRIERD